MSNIILHPHQSRIYYDLFVGKTVRNAVAVCCRGFGKSYLGGAAAVGAVFELMALPSDVPNKDVVIVAPTYTQVTDVYYDMLMYELGMEKYVISSSQATGRLVFPNNVELKLVSYEAVSRLRGGGIYFLVNDETRDWTSGNTFKDAWESVLNPCMTTRWSPKHAKRYNAVSPARSLTISTPKGYDYLYEMSRKCEVDKDYKTYSFNYLQAPLLDIDEVEKARQTMDPVSFAREYMGSFKDSGATIFYCFDRDVHVKNDLEYFKRGTHEVQGETVHIGIDFNVMKQCSSAFAVRGKFVHYLDEFSGSADTEQLAVSIKAKYWPNYNNVGHPEYKKKICKIKVYPDPAGTQRKTSATSGTTDHSILELHGFEVLAHKAHPKIVDSVNCVNRLLKTAAGSVYMYVHSRCKGLIMSLERTAWVDKNPDTATIDKSKGEEHFSDGVRYPMEYLFPINQGSKSAARGFGF